MSETWHDLGPAQEFKTDKVREARIGPARIAISWKNGEFGAISGVCNHVGGPLGEGRLDGEYVVCPWHYWKFHRLTGEGEPGFEDDKVPRYAVKEENGRLLIDTGSATKRHKKPHAPHRLARRAPVDVRGAVEDGARPCRRRACRRNPPDPPVAPEIPRLRGLLLEKRACLHLALLDHPDGRQG
jgi:nitrite reductase/ring-hydroxylating ferredoxin subunit